MTLGQLGIVEEWLAAVNRGDSKQAEELSTHDVEIVGPRGSARGRRVLNEWMARAGFHADALRWFCGDHGSVVVEQEARWSDASGDELGRAQVASQFVVNEGRIAYYQRHDSLHSALAEAGLNIGAEVTTRHIP